MNNEQGLDKEILQKIESGKVTMRSRSSFVWKTILWILAATLLAAVLIFIVSFIVFILRSNGNWDLPRFGLHGLVEFLIFFPWLFVPALILFMWLLERFILRYSVVYRIPVLYSAGIVIGVVIIASLAVVATPFHRRLFISPRDNQKPVARSIFRFFGGGKPDDFYVGTVTSSTPDSLSIISPEGRKITIYKNAQTQIISGLPIVTGDCLEIIGDEQAGNKMVALSVKKTDANVVEDCKQSIPPGLPQPSMSPIIIISPPK